MPRFNISLIMIKVPEIFITYFNIVYWYRYIILGKDTVIFQGQRTSVPITYCIITLT